MNNAWDIVKLARHPKRPSSIQLIKHVFDDFIELKGDRHFRDDPSIIGGIATFMEIPFTVIAEEKGINTQDKIKRNFGMPHPEGYKKALRLMKQAEKFHRPIFTIIDTPGAYPGIEAEERGQAQAIAYNLHQMMGIKTPIIVCVLSEGGSGGALAIGVGDYIMMLENSIYSILSFKDSSQAEYASNMMKITANDLLKFKVIDEIINEGQGLHEDSSVGINHLKNSLKIIAANLIKTDINKLLDKRYKKYRNIGIFTEGEEHEKSI
jgi:acetyl-CoA carboxylase carboxyl transferase subunit alpha